MLSFPDIDPKIISFGPLAVSWYSLSYVVGILLAWLYALKLIKYNEKSQITKKQFDDYVTWVIIGIIVGGRLGYVLFYDPLRFLANPIDIIKTYEGGMAFHGGITGYIIATYWFTRRNNLKFFELTDLAAAGTPIGLFFGRCANFVNAELYGRVTDVPWAFVFPYSDGQPRHPSQLYEAALEGIVLFIILTIAIFKFKALKKTGRISGMFLFFYGIFRFIVEFFREPDIQIGYIAKYFSMGQILCLPMILAGITIIIYSRKKCQ